MIQIKMEFPDAVLLALGVSEEGFGRLRLAAATHWYESGRNLPGESRAGRRP